MPLLEIKNLTAGYGDVDVVHDVSLAIAENEIVSLVGANGAGKTTLLRAISGVVRARGHITFAGKTRSLACHRTRLSPRGSHMCRRAGNCSRT